MVPRQNKNKTRLILLEHKDILKNGIGRPLVPALVHLLLRGHQSNKLTETAAKEVPPEFNVTIQRRGLVLGE
jgi:hypothetical protein